ncbi:disease resistance protein RGA2-like [Miscanthus floridulus]|uniref:disease resistance protein RGA2-like n=1 Tax=Miscanthus floridulus TaxID=154761 RepID=UPI00345A6011
MEVALSAISGEILSRFISFIIKKHTDRSCVEEKLERLEHLLLRVHIVVEEDEGRYLTNSKMLVQLRMLVHGMYQGYHVLNTFRLKPAEESPLQNQVTQSSALSAPLRRTRAAASSVRTNKASNHELQASLGKLETVVANMTEFVILLGGCKQMHKRPYDTYIYIDNFMFSRVVEKQELINALLQDNSPVGVPAVVPVIGAYRAGKKSLVGYVCNDNMVRSHFSSGLHLKSSNFLNFYSDASSQMGAGRKVIIVSRFQETARFGTVKPIILRSLSDAEFSYLFKVLAFGGTDPENHPQLESIAMELAMNLNGLLLVGNMLADMLRKNQDVQFWFHILKRLRKSIEHNFSRFGEHPKQLLERDHPLDITMLVPLPSATLCVMPSHDETRILPKVKLADIVQGSTAILPNEEFQIITKFVTNCIAEERPCTSSDNKRHKSACNCTS